MPFPAVCNPLMQCIATRDGAAARLRPRQGPSPDAGSSVAAWTPEPCTEYLQVSGKRRSAGAFQHRKRVQVVGPLAHAPVNFKE